MTTGLDSLNRSDIKITDDSPETVLAAMIADYEARTGKKLQPAHIERLLINTYAYRETLLRQQINEAYRQQHVRYATGLMLDLCGDDVNTPRLQASAARCSIRFTGEGFAAEVNIPAGTLVAAGETLFATVEAGQLTARQPEITLIAECRESGTKGNGWDVGQINTLQTPLTGADSITAANVTVPSGGADVESDAAYRERILLAFESFSVAGSVGAYQYWARAASPAVADVHVANDTDAHGNPVGGTVAVTLLTKAGAPSAELITQVQAALSGEKRRPLCDTVIVRAPEVLEYALDAELTLFTGANAVEVKAAAEAAWAAWESDKRAKLGGDIVPLDVAGCLKVAWVYNVRLTTPTLTVVKPHQWAKCTAVRITVSAERQDG
ncbi:hypothetical protein HpSP79_17710 [Helicobacter pylori]